MRSLPKRVPSALIARVADERRRCVHLFDEPQFNTQDGYIGFMLDFFRALRAEGKLVFLCLHPNEPYHLEILREIADRFVFVARRPRSPRKADLGRRSSPTSGAEPISAAT